MDPTEVEFLAEKEQIKVIPNFSQDAIYLISVSIYFTPLSFKIELTAIFVKNKK